MINLSQICLILGIGMIGSHAWALLDAKSTAAWLRRFPRNHLAGVILTLAATAWFEIDVKNENLEDIRWIKPALLVAFPAVGIGCCFYVRDFLAVRGLSLFLLILSAHLCEVARPHLGDTLWRDVLIGWAYVWVFFAFWLTLAPWRLRDWIGWLTALEGRLKLAAIAGIVWGGFVIGLGMTVLK
jgi:hypothetical protein